MFFPYMSSYSYLFGNRPQQRTPWDEIPGAGYGGTFGTKPWDTDTEPDDNAAPDSFHGFGSGTGRRRALGSGLMALGTSLLESAPRGDLAGGLARGAAGFTEAVGAERERQRRDEIVEREERRRQAEEARAEEQERDRDRAAELANEQGTAELAAWREQQDRGKQARLTTGKSAEQMVTEINELAARNPNDAKLQVMAKRAAGYALGEDSDLNKLADLHEQMTGQAFRQEDFDWKVGAERSATKADIAVGVRADPAAAERRANEELAISRGHLGIARERSNQEKEGLTDLQAYDRLEKKVKEKIDRRVQMQRDNVGREPTPAQMKEWRDQALKEAMAEMEQRVNQVYHFTRDGRFVPGGGVP